MQIFYGFHPQGPLGRLFVDKGAVGVDIFFVISGVVIYLNTARHPVGPGRFLLDRVARIAPAYWLYSTAFALLLLAVPDCIPEQRFEWRTFLLSLMFLPSANPGGFGLYPTLPVGWSLNYEMAFYLLFSLTLPLALRWRPLAIATALLVFCAVLPRLGWVSPFYRQDIVGEFLLGVGVGWLHQRGLLQGRGVLALLALVAALGTLWTLQPARRCLEWGLPCAVLVAACMVLEPWFARLALLSRLGDWSYSTYLLHVPILALGHYLLVGAMVGKSLVIVACLLVIGLLSWASHALVEQRLSRRLKAMFEREGESASLVFRQKY
jgi:peptidoglycan/LPS O-acetylase OafA/YrhL